MADKTINLEAMRHTAAHVLASAVQHIWPKAKFGVGPVVENGFYYDIDLGSDTASEDDLAKIEAEMRKIIAQNQPLERSEMPIEEAIEWADKHGQPYKRELLNDLKREGTTVAKELSSASMGVSPDILGVSDEASKVSRVSFYKNGDFTDLCRGPHVESTGRVGAFKLLRVSGAYWRGSEKIRRCSAFTA